MCALYLLVCVAGIDQWRAMSRQAHRVSQLPARFGAHALSKFYGQATKGARWMPWQKQAMKDAASCDKLRGAAHTL
jgi:hypothetical protein